MKLDVMEKACTEMFEQGYKLAKDVWTDREVSVENGRETGNGLQVTAQFWALPCLAAACLSAQDLQGCTRLQVFCETLTEEHDEGITERMFASQGKKGKESWSHWLCVEESQECTAAQYADIWPRKDKDDAKLAADVAAEAAAAVKAPKDET